MYIRTSPCLFHSKPVQQVHSTLGLLTHNATWCQNRGCICISSTRRTYGRIYAVSCIHPVIQTSTIILQTIISKEEEREDIQGEILQSSNTVFPHTIQHSTRVTTRLQCFYTQSSKVSKFPVILCKENYSTYRINSTTRILQEILQLQGSSRADRYKASSSNCSPCIQAFYMAEQGSRAPYSILSTPRIGQVEEESKWQKQHSKWQAASAHTLQDTPGTFLQNSTRRNRILSNRFKYYISL